MKKSFFISIACLVFYFISFVMHEAVHSNEQSHFNASEYPKVHSHEHKDEDGHSIFTHDSSFMIKRLIRPVFFKDSLPDFYLVNVRPDTSPQETVHRLFIENPSPKSQQSFPFLIHAPPAI